MDKEKIIQLRRYIEYKCSECGKEETYTDTNWGDEKPNLCNECIKKGWVKIGKKEADELLKCDQKLNEKLYRLSPFYKLK